MALNAKGECEPAKLIFRGAESPSVSADGRYVAFDTAQQLVPQDTNENVDVYVRDMDVPLIADRKDSGAYTLVSAKSGGEEPAAYAPRDPPWRAPNRAPTCGRTRRSGRRALRGVPDHRTGVRFPDGTAVDTPSEQLFVRDLQAKTTTLVTA